jgi:NAD(P)-dependent dehydrogenase (short-subunit alcohol dehydrogenase family)
MAIKAARETVLIAGASAGIGAAAARHLSAAGYQVFGTALSAPPSEPQGYRVLAMDARDPASIAAAIDSVMTQAGRIDVFINAAGAGLIDAVEEIDPDDMVELFEANVVGPLRVCQAVIPIMRRQKSGRIVHVSSLAARVGIPRQGAYAATRAALSRLSDSMRLELAPAGIRVTTIEPDDTKIALVPSPEGMLRVRRSSYQAQKDGAAAGTTKAADAARAADKVALLVERVLRAKKPRDRYQAALGREGLFFRMQHLLPDRSLTPRIGPAYEAKGSKADAG